ncbi:collagen binding domain-containing protein [Halorussus halobius]|uniref:hypothetical protein n=1 Tax=Halorussus halobius TaxID=1710537 RepID=UPI0010928E6B|nr:hypothetical protein [Halorussus halobius]
MADTRAHRRERLGALLAVGLLALSVVAGVAGIGAAHGGSDHVQRNGDEVEITLGDGHFDGDDRNVTVKANPGKTEQLSPDGSDGNETTYTVSVADLAVPKSDMSNASVTVEPDNGTAVTEGVDLRSLTFGGGDASVSGDTIQVPVQRALGYTNGSTVEATLAGDGAPVAEATVQYGATSAATLSVTLDAAQVDLPPSQGVGLSAANANETDLDLRALTDASTAVERVDDRTLRVASLLLADGVDYDLVATEPATNATFAATATASDGAVTVSDEALASADELAVSIYRNGSAVFEDVPYERADAAVANATVTANGTAVDLAGSSLSTNATTVWLANSSRYVDASVPVEDGTVNLSSTDYRLNENASYRLVVTGEQVVRAEVAGNGSANDSSVDSLTYAAETNESTGGTDDESGGGVLDQDPVVLVGAGVAASVVFGGIAFVVLRSRSEPSTPSGQQGNTGTGGSSPRTHDATIRVEDAATGSTVSAEVRATRKANNAAFQNSSPRGEVTETLTNGQGTLTLARGKWNVEVASHGASEQMRVNVKGDSRQRVELGPRQATVTVRDDDGDPLSDVAVTATPDEGRERSGRTDAGGEVTFDVPLAADEVAVEADHEKYDGDAATASVASGDASAALTLSPLTGDLDVTATVEGSPVAGLPVAVDPVGEAVEALGASRQTGETDGDGVASFEDLLVGEYEVEVTIPSGGNAFVVDTQRARIRDGRVARETLDASFEFGLSRNQRDRISSVRQEVDELVSISGRDVAIQRYYGSVVTGLLETVERLPREGHRFARADADPDAVADALLDAAESAAELVNEAMTTKRNSDLFGACVDMPDHRVEWEGGYDVETLFELLDDDRKNQRQTVLTQLRSVDDRINDERSDLASVSPARELWDRVKSFVNEEQGDDSVRGAAVAFAAGGLLDAVDELFDHDQLRDRLERTVF